MSTVDYSQHGEQQAILAWAEGGPVGSFCDLGCFDGTAYSNTAALAEAGWPGLCVDAAPDAAAACAARYRDRPDVEVLLAAFQTSYDLAPSLIHWTPGAMYTSLEPGRRADSPATPILIPPVDLGWLAGYLAEKPGPLFCSVDLEGGSIDAARWLVQWVSPACLCVEANNPSEKAQLAELLPGWRLLDENASNSVYAR